MRTVVAIVWLAFASIASAQPRVRPFMAAPGIPLGGRASAVGFCSTQQRAVVVLHTGDVVAVDAAGVIHPIGKVGPSVGPIACDRKNRITVVTTRAIVRLEGGAMHSTPTTTMFRVIRALDDDTVGLVDEKGVVYRFDGTKLASAWKTKYILAHNSVALDGSGERIVASVGNKIVVHDKSGVVDGPLGIRAIWLDTKTVLYVDREGGVMRWVPGTPIDTAERVHTLPKGRNMFARMVLHRAGARVIIHQLDAPLVALELDAAGKRVAETTISRLPLSVHVAAGNAAFAVLATVDRALVVDLQKSSAAVPHGRPLSLVSGLAFSPDGKKLAMLGGDRDILVAAIDRSSVTRLQAASTVFVRGPLRWAPDGTLFASLGAGQLRFNVDGTIDRVISDRARGFTLDGDPITLSREGRIVIERRHGHQTFGADNQFGLVEAHASERYLAARTAKRIVVYALGGGPDAAPVLRTTDRRFIRASALVGSDAAVMYIDEDGTLYHATLAGETTLAKIDGFPQMVASPDRQRIALSAGNSVQIWDASGQRVAQFLASGRVVALAWSPDLRTLAIASEAGVELWTIPR